MLCIYIFTSYNPPFTSTLLYNLDCVAMYNGICVYFLLVYRHLMSYVSKHILASSSVSTFST